MDINISQFKNSFFDYLRPNHYRVDFKKPGSLSFFNDSLSFSVSENLSAFCKSTSFPFFTFDTASIMLNNKSNTVINKIDYDPVSFTLNVDNHKEVLKFILDWKKTIINDKYQFAYKDEYKLDIDIVLLDTNFLQETAKCTLMDAILVNAEPIALSYESKDSISEISISVNFDHIEYDLKNFYGGSF